MIYLMQRKSGGQFDPPFEMTRFFFTGPLAEIEVREKEWQITFPDRKKPFVPDLLRCEYVPDNALWRFPKVIYNTSPKMWSMFPDSMGMLISERFHALIERLDPGTHQFVPVDIIHKKSGQKYSNQGQFYFFNALAEVHPQDLFDYPYMQANGLLKVHSYEHTTHRTIFVVPPRYSSKAKVFTYDHYRTRRQAFGKHHIVFCRQSGTTVEEGDVHGSSLWPLVTEEFKAAVHSLGVKSLVFYPIPTVDE